jgi:eukaryotic-like serine/threonine-protein kinase
VAIKVLPTSVASDAERLARFQREAEVLAALNHPNIAAIYGLERSAGITALVMELVEGPTLADRIARGAIPIDEALPIAKQIAEALEAAHERGMIHRDLKPANVKLRPDGAVKVLDFGLAKAMDPAGAMSPNLSNSPTITAPAMITGVGMILGTAAYMGPEQARGKRVDHRADVWAFGCVLFEMLTVRRAFGGETATEILAAVLERQPDWEALPSSTPSDIRRLLQRCLEKDPKNRLHAIADVRLALEDARHDGTTVAPANISRVAWGAVALGCAASLVVGWLLGSRLPASAPGDVSRWLLDVRPATALLGAFPSEYARFRPSRTAVALSPNGRTIAFTAQRDGTTRLYIRALDRMEASVIAGTDGADGPFFSPDGTWVGFWANGAIRKVPLTGGPPVKVSDTELPSGATWASDDTIVFANATAIWEVSSSGGTPRALTKLGQGEFRRVLPTRLPGSRWLLFTVLPATFDWERSRVVAQSLDTGEQRVLLEGATDARYVPTGHLVFMRLGNLMAAPFDADGARLTGPEVGVIEAVMQSVNTTGVPTDTGAGQYTFSSTGTIAYVAGELIPDYEATFHWIRRDGSIEPIGAPPKPYNTPRLSPDGRHVVASTWGLRDRNLWRYDFDTGNLTRLTTEGRAQFPAWSPDGKTVLFSLGLTGPPSLFSVRADGSAAPTRLGQSEYVQFPGTWTPDGRTVLYAEGSTIVGRDIKAITLGSGPARPILATRFSEFNPELSPDGRWLAYVSDETGREEVYVQAFPDPGGKRMISTTGGNSPVWSLDGRKLFYLSPPSKPRGSAWQLMESDVTLGSAFAATPPRPLFEPTFAPDLVRTYDLTPNADRFIFLRVRFPPATSAPREIHVVQNWSEELKRLVPTK